jgi:hypothetical protein
LAVLTHTSSGSTIAGVNLRNYILAGLALSLFTIAFTFGKILLNFSMLAIVGVVTVLYGYAAIREIPARTGSMARSSALWRLLSGAGSEFD